MRTLKWPVIALVIIGVTHLVAEAIWSDLQTIFIPAVVAPVLLAVGVWIGVNAVRSGGNIGPVMIAGAVLGLLPLALDVIGFGILLDRGAEAGRLAGTFGFLMVFWGSLIGGGFTLSRAGDAAPATTTRIS
jgi:hypothetical protein